MNVNDGNPYKKLNLKSLPSNDAAYISFTNNSSSIVDIIWYDFEGYMVKYGELRPGATQDVNTFSKHAWKSFDRCTGNEMLLNGHPVFNPVSVREIHERLRFVRVPVRSLRCGRTLVYISAPFTSLLELCKQVILRSVDSTDNIEQLDIPDRLKKQLLVMVLRRMAYRDSLKIRYN